MISDNILITFEMFHYMKNSRGGGGHMALKLDMAKAYDRVEWVFLRRVLFTMGFDGGWVYNVMRCVESVSFKVLINGSPSDVFVPERGIRQEDPLSPYLFIICAEFLSSLICRRVEAGMLHGIQIAPQAPVISHLFFADDSIIFMKANEN
ncbi:secreted RxLR effector protein 78-like [Silene latifolia]|uniref:secreted RxLR effector protein 78-like n=1 Tax=Silene latifolia TaxID=37657 RepID=UPI003D781BC7